MLPKKVVHPLAQHPSLLLWVRSQTFDKWCSYRFFSGVRGISQNSTGLDRELVCFCYARLPRTKFYMHNISHSKNNSGNTVTQSAAVT
jgi:hypothetical protein